MGFGLYPKEQLDCLTTFHEWLDAKPKGQRSMLLIGGDLHMAIRTEICHYGRLLWEQYVTSPMRQHPPPNVAFVGMKGVMLYEEKLPQGYRFQHTMIEPCRNFGIIYAEAFSGCDSNVRCHLYLHGNKDMFGDAPYYPGELLVKDIVITGINTNDVYAKFSVLKQEQKTEKSSDTVKKFDDIRFGIEKGEYSSEKPELDVKVYHHTHSVHDSKLGTLTIGLSDMMSITTTPSSSASSTSTASTSRVRNQTQKFPVHYKDQTGELSFTLSWRPFHVDG